MIGANVIFHLGSLLAAIAMVVFLMRLQKERNTLRQLLPCGGGKSFVMAKPAKYLSDLCKALDLAFEDHSPPAAPSKIHLQPWRELFLTQRVYLLRCKSIDDEKLEVEVCLYESRENPSRLLVEQLATSLGDNCNVKLESKRGQKPMEII